MSIDQPEMVQLIVNAAVMVQFTRYCIVSAYALQLYEWSICFSDEYLYVHKARWTSVKFAYLLSRYFPLFFQALCLWAWVGNHPLSVCHKVVRPVQMMLPVFVMIAQIIFIIRTYAFTGRNKFLLAFLVACLIAFIGSNFWMMSQWTLVVQLQMMFGDSACFALDPSASPKPGADYQDHHSFNAARILLICQVLFDSLMTVIIVVHCIRFRAIIWGPLGKVFVVQTVMAYVMISALSLAAAILLFEPDRQYDGLASLRDPLSCILGCRLILMLRRRVDPTATTQVRNRSLLVRDDIGRMEAAEVVVIDDVKNHPIESWD